MSNLWGNASSVVSNIFRLHEAWSSNVQNYTASIKTNKFVTTIILYATRATDGVNV